MDAIQDFEDLLQLFHRYRVRYLIIGGLAFIYYAKPRYTKALDLWLDPESENIKRANKALAEFGSPLLLNASALNEILQLGAPPNRIDLFLKVKGARFKTAWQKRIRGRYGRAPANWIDIDTLIRIKSCIDHPRHQEDVRVLREVRRRHRSRSKKKPRSQGQ